MRKSRETATEQNVNQSATKFVIWRDFCYSRDEFDLERILCQNDLVIIVCFTYALLIQQDFKNDVIFETEQSDENVRKVYILIFSEFNNE